MPNAIQDPLDRLSTIIEGEKSPFVELSERMKTSSKDIMNLNLAITDLAIAIEKRAGVNKDKKEIEVEPKATLKSDLQDFKQGFIDYFKDKKDYITSKSEITPDITKVKKEEDDNSEIKEVSDLERSNIDQNKILSDMVEVLIDMRDDKSQKQLLDEATSIKKLITDQNKKTELPGGIEPNREEEKDLDRQKLADLIARKLGEVMSDMGIGSNAGIDVPDLPDRGNKKGNKPNKPGRAGSRVPGNVGNAARLGGRLAGGIGLAYGVYEASEYLDEVDYGQSMSEGAGMEAQKAFRENVGPTIDPTKANISKEEALNALENGSPRDLEKLGGVDKLREVAGLPPLTPIQTEPAKPFEQASLRKYDYIPEVTTKQSDVNVGQILNEVSDKNTELKMFNMSGEQSQMLAPIISNKTINNTEQTMITSSPSPHSNASSLNRWQQKRSTYTD